MASLASIEALVFDVFGTVVDWRSSVSRALRDVGGLSADDADAFADEWRIGYERRTAEIAFGADGPLNAHILHREILDNILASSRWRNKCGNWDEGKRKELNLIWHRLDGWADSSPGLYLLKKKLIVGSLSNGNVKLLVDMARHANLPWDVVFSGELFGSYKPNQQMYLSAAKHLSLPTEKIAMVAAHIADLRAASTHGMKTVYLRRPTEDNDIRDGVQMKSNGGDVDVIVDSLEELAALI